MLIFYYFLKRMSDGYVNDIPMWSEKFLGDIGEEVEIDGVLYTIVDYTEEMEDMG